MTKSVFLWLFTTALSPTFLQAQKFQILDDHGQVSLRGLSAPGKGVVWASGSGGTVGRSTDGGAHWHWISVSGYGRTEFRDIEGFDSLSAVIMGVDTPAVILRTSDGGAHWKEVFRDTTPGMFLDAMAFADGQGIVVGDPIGPKGNARFFLAVTTDAGASWTPFPMEMRPRADSAEGCFASSGTNILLDLDKQGNYAFVSGGPSSRYFKGNSPQSIPLVQGAVSTGANSVARDKDRWVIVGGDFAHDTIVTGNCAYSTDGGAHWTVPPSPPHGYRSCVVHLWQNTWLCCGTSGIDLSNDGGAHWSLISKESFHVAAYPGTGRSVYLAGSRGRVAKLDF